MKNLKIVVFFRISMNKKPFISVIMKYDHSVSDTAFSSGD